MVPIIINDELILCEMVRKKGAKKVIYDDNLLQREYPEIYNYIIKAGSYEKKEARLNQEVADPKAMIENDQVFTFMKQIMSEFYLVERERLNLEAIENIIRAFETLYGIGFTREKYYDTIRSGAYNASIWDGNIEFTGNKKGQSL